MMTTRQTSTVAVLFDGAAAAVGSLLASEGDQMFGIDSYRDE